MQVDDLSVSECVAMAKIAEQAERFDDMKDAMKRMVKETTTNLTSEERNLLSVAYKNVVGTRRSAWRMLTNIESKESDLKDLVKEYKETVKKELREECMDIIDLLDTKFFVSSSSYTIEGEEKVFFLKMKGDYYRYITEILETNDEKADFIAKANEAYKDALAEAEEKLKSSNPVRLGLALNYSVFYYEIMEKVTEACDLAKSAFDDAITELESDESKSENYKDSALILQLLRDNLTLWSTDTKEDQ